MKVNRGQIFRYDNGEFLVAREDAVLENSDDSVSVFWSKTNFEQRYPMEKSTLEQYTDITDDHHNVPEDSSIERLEEDLGLRHEKCGNIAVTNDDFVSAAKKLAPGVLVGVIRAVVAGAIGCVAELFNRIYSLYKAHNKIKNFSPDDWFKDIAKETTERYKYKHISCGHKIDVQLSDS